MEVQQQISQQSSKIRLYSKKAFAKENNPEEKVKVSKSTQGIEFSKLRSLPTLITDPRFSGSPDQFLLSRQVNRIQGIGGIPEYDFSAKASAQFSTVNPSSGPSNAHFKIRMSKVSPVKKKGDDSNTTNSSQGLEDIQEEEHDPRKPQDRQFNNEINNKIQFSRRDLSADVIQSSHYVFNPSSYISTTRAETKDRFQPFGVQSKPTSLRHR